ncbi:MAG: hypothetical protein GY780_11410 [bacterium]|nr:hypothetical protein [bacterium]
MHTVTLSGSYFEEFDGEISGLVFKCEAIGICESSFFSPDEPLPFEPHWESGEPLPVYEATAEITPPHEGVIYRYQPYAIRPDGSRFSIHPSCSDSRGYALTSDEGVPFLRGTLELSGSNGDDYFFHIEPCPDDCWTEEFFDQLDQNILQDLSGESWTNLLGQVVNLYGERTYCTMPGGNYYNLSQIDLMDGGNCGPVPLDNVSWSNLKAYYR